MPSRSIIPIVIVASSLSAHIHDSGAGQTGTSGGDGGQSRRRQPGPERQRRDGTEGERREPHNLPSANVLVPSSPSSVNTGVRGFNALAVVTRRVRLAKLIFCLVGFGSVAECESRFDFILPWLSLRMSPLDTFLGLAPVLFGRWRATADR